MVLNNSIPTPHCLLDPAFDATMLRQTAVTVFPE